MHYAQIEPLWCEIGSLLPIIIFVLFTHMHVHNISTSISSYRKNAEAIILVFMDWVQGIRC